MGTPADIGRRLAERFKEIIDGFSGESAGDLVRRAKRRAGVIELEAAKQAYDTGAVLLDVREAEEWREGHAKNAVHVPRGMLEFQAPKEKRLRDKDTPIITYCTAGARSALAAERLEEMGWRDVLTLDAGYDDWKSAGYPVERGGYEELEQEP